MDIQPVLQRPVTVPAPSHHPHWHLIKTTCQATQVIPIFYDPDDDTSDIVDDGDLSAALALLDMSFV